MKAWNLLLSGVSQALKYWQALLVVFLAQFIVIVLLATLPALTLVGPGHSTAISEAANGIDAWMVTDFLSLPLQARALPAGAEADQAMRDYSTIVLTIISTIGLLTVASWLVGNLLFGGLLLIYKESPQPFHLGRFLWGCWHWWSGFLLLGFVEMILFLFLILPIGIAAGYLAVILGSFGWLVEALILLLAGLFLALFEIARVSMVINDRRNPFAGIWNAIQLIARHPFVLMGFYALTLLILLLLSVVFRLGFFPRLPLSWWLLVFFVQQVFVILRLWARSVRLWGGISLAADAVKVRESLISSPRAG